MDSHEMEHPIPRNRLLTLYEISKNINTILDLNKLLEKVMDLMIRELNAERGLILFLNEESDEFEVSLARNLDNNTIQDATEYSRNIVNSAGKGQIILSHDACDDDRFQDFSSVVLHNIRSLICVPLKAKNKIIGTIYVDCRKSENQFDEEDLNFLQAFANQAAVAIENARLYELATVDDLTGVFMRHHFERLMNDELIIAEKYGFPLSIVLVDVDNFKEINDVQGHLTGDEVLRRVGNNIRSAVDQNGISGRYGGDEFIIMLPRINPDDSLRIAEKLRAKMEETNIVDLLGTGKKLTVSIGVSSFPSHPGDMLIKKADDALYQAKQEGRNCVRFV